MTKARIREIRAQAKALSSKAPSPQTFTESNMLTTAAMLTECLLEIESFNRRARRGEDLSTDPQELPLAAKVNPPSKARATQGEMEAYADSLGLPPDDGAYFFDRMETSGWKIGGKPIKDWQAGIRSWKRAGYLPSQKNQPKAAATGPARCTL